MEELERMRSDLVYVKVKNLARGHVEDRKRIAFKARRVSY